MGSPEGEKGREKGEIQHEVTLTRAFFVGVFPVTQKQYELVMGRNPSFYKGDGRPVESVSWTDAHAFAAKLEERSGLSGFTLPSEALWEYVCRAGETTALNSGKNLSSQYRDTALNALARYGYDNGYLGGTSDGKGGYAANHTTVGSYAANTWGFYDFHGNVYEWCEDWEDAYEPDPVTDPKGPPIGRKRILRGGAWNAEARYCRAAYRYSGQPDMTSNACGFRVCCPAAQ